MNKICKVLTDVIFPLDKKGESYIKDTYHFKEIPAGVEIGEGDIIGSVDFVRMFPNVLEKKTLEVVNKELCNDESLSLRVERFVFNIGGNLLQNTGQKDLFSKRWSTIDKLTNFLNNSWYLHIMVLEELFVQKGSSDKDNIMFWKGQMDNMFFVLRGRRRIQSFLCGF